MVLCFVDIAKRDEDLLYDSLAVSSAKIFEHLGPFMTNEEVKVIIFRRKPRMYPAL
jgi:hypothetical protein